MNHYQSKYYIEDQQHNIDGKSIVPGVKAHGRYQDGEQHRFENDDAIRDADQAKEKPRHRIALTPVVVWPHHQIGGMAVQNVQQDEKGQEAPKQSCLIEYNFDYVHILFLIF